MTRISTIVMALALVLSLSQCKKNEQNNAENQNAPVTITLNVSGNNGSKVIVNPATGTVDFENNDQIIVASGGKYVGTLTYNGSLFTGAISNATEGYPLQFYFLGNVTPAETLTSGVTESCSVVISDQTEHLPVISAASSNENYTASTTDYTAHLLNKCALVKFDVTTSSEAATCVAGFNNKVTVNFTDALFTYSKVNGGNITLPSGSGERWAILLPQEAMEAGEAGSAYSADGAYTGTRGAVPTVLDNGYLTVGIEVYVSTEINPSVAPAGAINGKFTINANGDKIYFSQGNLQYQASTNTWRFGESQYDYVGNATLGTVYENGIKCNNNLISQDYSGWIDLFGWGTSGYNHGAVCYYPWSTSTSYSYYYAYGNDGYSLCDQTGQADWGYNPISNGGYQPNQWRTLTGFEWDYVFDNRTTTSGIRYAKAKVCDINGVILLPDDWNPNYYNLTNTNSVGDDFSSNIITAAQWIELEQYGVVFLPAAGNRDGTTINNVGNVGSYWSASRDDWGLATNAYFHNADLIPFFYTSRSDGISVRLVHNVE